MSDFDSIVRALTEHEETIAFAIDDAEDEGLSLVGVAQRVITEVAHILSTTNSD